MQLSNKIRTFLLGTTCMGLVAAPALAQDASNDEADARELDKVVVVGSQIVGSDIAGALPVTVLNVDDIDVTGAGSGDELLRAIPQVGDIIFSEAEFTGVNGARGDIGSINLRGIGTGNTLVLLNGRRLVLHPGTQVEDFVPVTTVNSQSLPVTGIQRLEVLRDGAAAIYGTDAVAGVINTITQDDFEGLEGSLRYGGSEDRDLRELTGTIKWGKNFNDDRTNVSIFANFLDREGFRADQLRNTSTEDLRTFFEGTAFEGDTQLRNLSTQTQWAEFRSLEGTIAEIGDDDFHIQPNTFAGCLVDLGNGVCADNGGSIDTALRLDRARYREIVGDTERQNLMAFVNHEFLNGTEFFGEATYYHADYNREREAAQILSSGRLTVSADAFYNPFGVDLQIRDYRPLDVGPRRVDVENESFRLLGGLRGDWGNWNWETALLHSEAETTDLTTRVSNTLFQQAINGTTADAYNIFAGGDVNDTNAPGTFNNQAIIDSFLVPVSRIGETSLTLADFKLSSGSIFELPAGSVGIALGAEYRREEFTDDRDARLDGTIVFTDSVTGNIIPSDVMGSSPTPDTDGDRDVFSAFAELAVPLVSEDMNIPLVHSLDAQLAVRAEDYSDVGSVAKPKIALSWYPHPDFQVRAAYSQGFRAPNLEQINATGIRRVNGGREDWILCEAVARANGTTFDTGNCDGNSVESVRSGGPDLQPEENDNISIGLVYQPSFVDDLTFTVDWWRIEQEDVVGIFGDQNQISLDYVLRLNGSSNPNVVRAAPSADEIALYTAAGLTPAGEIIEVADQYVNLNPREFEGIDFGMNYGLDTDAWGDFTFKVNAAYLNEAFQAPSAEANAILSAVEAGTANEAVDVPGSQDRVQQNGRPEWRGNASMLWRQGPWGAGLFYNYVGEVIDTSVTGPNGEIFEVDSFETVSLYGEYTFEEWLGGDTRVRVGARNITDEDPPIADEFASGYFPSLHSNRGRYWYVDIRKEF
ncbi:MAG: TonB-dependent receptor plug domain-containing protein [Henriciella sp.]